MIWSLAGKGETRSKPAQAHRWCNVERVRREVARRGRVERASRDPKWRDRSRRRRGRPDRRSPAAAFVKAAAGLALAGLVMLAPLPVRAQQLCLVRADAVAQLKRDHGEEPKALGLVEGGRAVVELFVSEEGGWTLLLTDAEGHTCLVGSGAAWTTVAPRPGNPA